MATKFHRTVHYSLMFSINNSLSFSGGLKSSLSSVVVQHCFIHITYKSNKNKYRHEHTLAATASTNARFFKVSDENLGDLWSKEFVQDKTKTPIET